jgi:hypothetical protein
MATLNQTTWDYIAKRNIQIANLLAKHLSPPDECSYAKGIPYTYGNMTLLRQLGKLTGIRLRYRGQRTQIYRDQRQSYCLQRDASFVSVYPR